MRVRRLVFVLLGCAGCSLVIDGDLISVHCEDEGAFGPPACPEHDRCVDHICVSGHAAAPSLGSRCTHDSECDDTDFCLDPTLFGGPGPSVCSRPCCSSSGCDPDTNFVCWSPAVGGGDFCVAGAILGRNNLGEREPGVACSSGADCRSGDCSKGHCNDPCCTDTNCAASHRTCQFGKVVDTFAWTCEPPNTKQPTYASCSSDDQCASGLCIAVGGKLRCSVPCCSSSECNPLPNGDSVVCDDVEHDKTQVRACSTVVPEIGTGVVGAPCHDNAFCRSARCVKDNQGHAVCTDVCCLASDCGDPMLFACLPTPPPDGGGSHSSSLRCQRK